MAITNPNCRRASNSVRVAQQDPTSLNMVLQGAAAYFGNHPELSRVHDKTAQQQCSTAAILHSNNMRHSSHTAQHGTARHGTARHGTARHGTARHGTAQHSTAQHSTAQRTLRKPYSVSATKAMGAVEMNTPAMGMKLQMKTNKPSKPIPGICNIHMPSTVKAVLAIAICACSARLNSGYCK